MVIGVVGKISSGKTTVCHFIKESVNDSIIIDVDRVAKDIYKENPDIIKDLISLFGAPVCRADGTLDFSALALKVFSSKKDLEKINQLMFPLINKKASTLISKHKKDKNIIIDAAVLFGSGIYKLCDFIIWVRADRKMRVDLFRARCELDLSEIKTRIDGQFIEIKRNRVDFIINNNKEIKDLENKVKRIVEKIKTNESGL